MKKTSEQLINNTIGQLEGVKKMIHEKRDCFEIIVQMKAAKSSFNKVFSNFVESNIEECATGVEDENKDKLYKLLKEISEK
jgi:DNA-binding FrmR family transcriptional regulator